MFIENQSRYTLFTITFWGGGERDYQFKIRNMFIDKQNWVRCLSLLLGVEGEAENGKAKFLLGVKN